MREEDGGARYMSPLVKQDLAKLEKDGESRRVALHALKQFVENLEPSSVPRFLAQVSESKDTGGSRSYAISLYEEVARVHGKLIIPQIGRVMATVTRSLSASGSSPQLHQACAKVAAALVRYSIDSDTSAAEAEEILKEVSRPLVDLLAGKLEPVAAGAATCMQALVESEKWKLASADLTSEVCHRTTSALGDKSTRTVAHMQLARSLATNNPRTLNVYGACLLHAGEEVLSVSAYSWQHRKCAAKMVQAVLAIVDRDTLALEFNAITQVLENCKHDRMPHVRSAVCEALQTAKMFMAGETIKEEDDGNHRVAGSNSFVSMKETPQRKNWSSNKYSPSSQDTYNLSSFTPPPAACDSATSDPFSTPHIDSTGRMKRSLQFPSRTDNHSPFPSATAPATGLTNNHDPLLSKENMPPSVLGGNLLVSRRDLSGHYVPAPLFYNRLVDDKATGGMQRNEKESLDEKDFTPPIVTQDHPKGKVESRFSPFEALITRSFGEAEGDLMAEDEEILSGGSAELDGRLYDKKRASTRGNSRLPIATGQFEQDSQTPESMADSERVQSNSISYRSMGSSHTDSNDSALLGKKGCDRNSMTGKFVDVLENKQISHMGSLQGDLAGNPSAPDLNAGISHAQYMKLANMSSNPEDGFSALKPRVLITTADFLPYTTPRRLVLSLQSQLSSPDSKGDEVGKEDMVRRIDAVEGKRIEFNEDADMDVESSSDSGWSVRDNPIASNESLTEDSSEEEVEERHTEIYEALALPRMVQNVAGVTSQKKSLSPPLQEMKSLGIEDSKIPGKVEQGSLKVEDTAPCRQSPKPLGTPAGSPVASPACSSCTGSQRKRSALKAQEWDLRMDVNRGADGQRIGARRSMPFEQEAEAAMNVSQGKEVCANEPVDEDAEESASVGWWKNSSFVRSAKNSCLRLTSIAEAVLGGSLCVVIAVPVTMILARALQTPPDHFLVPT